MSVKVSDFMMNLVNELKSKKDITESSASSYIRSLYTLNGKKDFKTLTFLKDTEAVDKIMETYAVNTQKTMLAGVCSVLSLYKDKPTYKRVYKHYFDRMMNKQTTLSDEAKTGEKSTKQKENWIDWNDVKEVQNQLCAEVYRFVTKKTIPATDFATLLHYVILGLYTEIQPRRNQDYLDMVIVKKWTEDMSKDKNYLDLNGGRTPIQFIFNKFKTAKTYGQQKIEIPEDLRLILFTYVRFHPLGKSIKTEQVPFLVFADGKPLKAVNAITRILNKIFGKKVGSSMLRHSYLSSKYADVKDDMIDDAEKMGHSVSEQQGTYVKRNSVEVPTYEPK